MEVHCQNGLFSDTRFGKAFMKSLAAIKESVLTKEKIRRAFIFTIPDQSVCYWSAAMFEILGLEPINNPTLDYLFDSIHDSDRIKVKDIYHTFIERPSSKYAVDFKLVSATYDQELFLFVQQEEFGDDIGILLFVKPAVESQLEVIPGDEIARELKVNQLTQFFEGIGYWEYYPDEDRIKWSNQIYNMLGVHHGTSLSFKDFSTTAFPEDVQNFQKIINELSQENSDFQIETRHIVNGDLIYGLSRGTSLWNGSRMLKMMGSFEDITQYQVTQERLQHIEQIANVGWYEINLLDKKKSLASDQYLKMHGFEFTGRMPSINELLACIHPDDQERVVESRNSLYKDYTGWLPFEYRVVMSDGTIRYIESVGEVIKSSISGEPFKVIAVTKDITEIKLKELQLTHANELAQLGWYENDVTNDELKVSKEFLSIHELDHYDRDEFWKKVHPDDVRELDKISHEFPSYEHGYSFQYRITLKSGDLRYAQNIGKYVRDPVSNKLIKVMGTVQDITRFKSLEDRLQRAQKISQTGWFEYDMIHPTGSSFSQEWLDMHDFDHQPKKIDDFLDKIHPIDRQMIPSMAEFLNKMPDEWYHLDYRILTRYGHKRYISNSARVVYKDGQPSKIFGTTIDVTKSRVTERALKESERKYRLMSENSRDAILLLEAREKGMVITFASDYVEDLSGYSKYKLLGMEATQLMHKEDKLRFNRDILPKLLFAQESTAVVFRLFREDGEYLWVEANVGVLIEETPVKIQLSVRDISERKAFEEQLLMTNNDLQAMIKATEDIVFIAKPDLTFERVIVNDESKLHIPSADFIGKKLKTIWADDNGKVLCKMVEDAFRTGKSGRHDYPYTLRGVLDWYRAHIHIFKGYDEQERVSVMIEKITTQKKAEEELRRTMEMERELSRMRSSFVSMASHQFKTPLTVIKSNMQLLDLSGKDDPLTKKVSARLTREVDRMVVLMEDILTLGKAQSGAIKPRFKMIDLVKLINSIKSDVDMSQKDGRSLKLEVIGNQRMAKLDEGLMRQAILNLVTNAFKYSYEKPNPVVTIDYSSANSIKIIVKDFGLGISEDNLSRIFKDFYRSEEVSHIPGTGLGLSVTSEFLKINKCTISVESELGEGSLFTVLIRHHNER